MKKYTILLLFFAQIAISQENVNPQFIRGAIHQVYKGDTAKIYFDADTFKIKSTAVSLKFNGNQIASTSAVNDSLEDIRDAINGKVDKPLINQTFNDTLYFNKIFRHYNIDTLRASLVFKVKNTGKISGYTEQLTRYGNGSATIDTTGNFAKKIKMIGYYDSSTGKINNITAMYDGLYIWISILQPNE